MPSLSAPCLRSRSSPRDGHGEGSRLGGRQGSPDLVLYPLEFHPESLTGTEMIKGAMTSCFLC